MRLPCHLRALRGDHTLLEIVAAAALADEPAAISEGELSKIERGIGLPRDSWLPALEHAYGAPRHEFWPPQVLVVLSTDEAGA